LRSNLAELIVVVDVFGSNGAGSETPSMIGGAEQQIVKTMNDDLADLIVLG
jgi:hypothetical protein